ncbi:MAG: c-type cytochrome [Caulobacteraceae bacterium]
MRELTVNKVLGAALATGLVIVFMFSFIPPAFQSVPARKPGYAIAVPANLLGGGPPAAPAPPPDWGTVLTNPANVAAGQAKTVVCQSCHNFTPVNKIGPGLFGVVGRQPGTHPGFDYSDAMKAFGKAHPVWTYDLLFHFLKGPQGFVPGTKMTFVGFDDPKDRVDVIAYLHTLGSTLPIPPPAKPAKTPVQGSPSTAKPGKPTPARAGAAGGAPVSSGPSTKTKAPLQATPGGKVR